MSGTSPNFGYWRRLSAVSIYEISCLLAGFDPRAMSDVVGPNGDPLDLSEELNITLSALLANQITPAPGQKEPYSKETVVLKHTIHGWLKKIGHSELAAALSEPSGNPVTEDQVQLIDCTGGTPPGKIPRTAASKLAIFAAWEIEQRIQRRPTIDEVMEKLGQWAIEGKYPEILRSYDPSKKRITWTTSDNSKKYFDKEACKKALFRWNKSREAE